MLTNHWKFQNRSVQTFGFVYHDTNGQNLGSVWKTQSFLLSEICMVILWQDYCGKGNLRKSCWEKVSNCECLFVHREKGLFLSVYVDDIKLTGKKQNLDPMWKLLNKEVDLGEPTSFLDHVYLGCTQRQCEISKDIVDNYRTMFESRISAGGVEKLPFPQNLRISSWSNDMAGHAKKCAQRYCELANKTTQQSNKVSTPCIDDHHFKDAPKLFWNACTWHVLEELIFYVRWTNLHDRLQNGPKLMTNDWIVDILHPSQTVLLCG